MTNRTKNCLLIIAGIATAIYAQSSPTNPPEFDAASIKPAGTPTGGRIVVGYAGRLEFTPGMVASRAFVSAGRTILEAYHLHDYQLIGGPGWLATDLFALEAKAATPANDDQLRLMLQTLLSQRFKLVMHRETRVMPVWALTVAKGGPKLHEMKPGESVPSTREELARLGLARTVGGPLAGNLIDHGNVQTLVDQLYMILSRNDNGIDARPVLDKTGLTGNYLFFMQWGAEDDFKDVVTQVTGLKLESQKAPVEVLVIDHIEKPDAN